MDHSSFESYFRHTAQRIASVSPQPLNDKFIATAARRDSRGVLTPRHRRRDDGNVDFDPQQALTTFPSPQSRVTEQRLLSAAERRERDQQQRMQRLAERNIRRTEKVTASIKRRGERLAAFRENAPQALSFILGQSGLVGATPECVEDILTADPVLPCGICGAAAPGPCPATGKVHRRKLLSMADALLASIAQICPMTSKAPSTEDTKIKPGRKSRPAVSPQQFLIAFHLCADTTEATNSTVRLLAQQMLKCFAAIEAALRDDEPTSLLHSLRDFALSWRFYHRGITEILQTDGQTLRRELTGILSRTYMEILRAHIHALRRQEPTRLTEVIETRRRALHESILEKLAVLKERIHEMGGDEAVNHLAVQEAMLYAVPSSPEFSAHTVTTDACDSDNGVPTPMKLPPSPEDNAEDVASHIAKQLHIAAPEVVSCSHPSVISGVPLGCELPPHWTKDDRGTSRSPGHSSESLWENAAISEDEEKGRVSAQRVEYRARKAHESRVRCSWSNGISQDDSARKDLNTKVADMILERTVDLVPSDPKTTKQLLQTITDELVEAYPEHHRAHVGSSLADSLDYSVLRFDCPRKALAEVVRVVLYHVTSLGAPARIPEIQEGAARVYALLEDEETTSLKTASRAVIHHILASIKTMRKDIATYSLEVVQPELRRRSVEYERVYFGFLMRHPTTEVLQWSNRIKGKTNDLTDAFAIKRAVASELISLLASSGKGDATHRWASMPTDLLRFDIDNIFGFAYATQLLTIRLLLSGIVSLMLTKHRSPISTDAMKALDAEIKSLLTSETEAWGSARLETLKATIVGFLNSRLHIRGELIPIEDEAVVRGVVDRMTDNTSHEYNVCEARVINVLRSDLSKMAEYRCLTVAEDLRKLYEEVHCVVEYHWEVFNIFYTAQMQ